MTKNLPALILRHQKIELFFSDAYSYSIEHLNSRPTQLWQSLRLTPLAVVALAGEHNPDYVCTYAMTGLISSKWKCWGQSPPSCAQPRGPPSNVSILDSEITYVEFLGKYFIKLHVRTAEEVLEVIS